jgi:hypothetical protein
VALPRDLAPGEPVTWVGPPLDDASGLAVQVGERGVFLDHDGDPEQYVVSFPGGRVFCCLAADVEPDPPEPPRRYRRHGAG